jgi:hypothetical protein
MPKEEKTRTFESENLILPALKMILKKKAEKDFNEETVMRIIDRLIAKD